MGTLRAQVTFQGSSNLPEDQYVNTFHFVDDSNFDTQFAVVTGHLGTFYETPATTPVATNAVGKYISSYVLRPYTIRCYDMTTPAPRVPAIAMRTLPTPETGSTATVPHEVAACLSFHGEPPVTGRRRGRIYLGPLNSGAVGTGTTTVLPHISGNLRESLVGAGLRLLTADAGWAIFSQTDNAYVPVAGGWVDNEFDTQRRRGGKAFVRTVW